MNYDVFSDLNEEQTQAVKSTEGYYRVIAGAGSGKTRALTHRYVHLVENMGISTDRVLSVTFTNKAAKEMKKRIRNMIGDKDLGYVCTFHGFAVQFLREDCHVVQYPKDFIVLDDDDTQRLVRIAFTQFGITSRHMTVEQAIKGIYQEKDKLDYVPYLIDISMTELNKARQAASTLFDKVWFEYLYLQRKNYGLDFQDLLNFMLHILINDKEKKDKWQQRLEYIMIDEFQDVSTKELAIAQILSDYHKNLFIVGDPDQTLYEWRRARVETILEFDEKCKPCTTIIMDKNYRSLAGILTPANELIKKNEIRIEKNLVPVREGECKVIYYHAKTGADEAHWVSQEITKLQEQGAALTDIAVLYRAHYVSRLLEESFLKENIPHVIYSGVPFYGRKEIKDVLSYLRMLIHTDDLSFERIVNEPRRGIGKTRMAYLRNYAESNDCSLYTALVSCLDEPNFKRTKGAAFVAMVEKYKREYVSMSLTDLLLYLLRDSGYEEHLRVSGEEDRLDNLAELKQSIFEYETTAGEETSLESYLQNIALFTNDDMVDKKESVSMMTIHTAKGLEFPYVFLCGMSEGILPSRRANTHRQLEEERRLAYVAFTRAEDKLYLSDAEGEGHGGQYRYPSRFIFDAGKENIEYVFELNNDLIDEARSHVDRLETLLQYSNDFDVGDRVSHEFFGPGEVLQVDIDRQVYLIKFDSIITPRSIDFRLIMSAL
ncbi:MAG: UvrD-helicase domain-containing protein [Oscillospiraceae bacterium]|nr:UvrD-helicase domain-containing protein [Oscillospiraceae bacterium]